MPFSCQARKHSALSERLRLVEVALNAAVTLSQCELIES